MVTMKKFFSLIPKKHVASLSDSELKALRKKYLTHLAIVIVSGIITIELALWYGYETLWQVLFLIVCIIALPMMLSTSRLSSEYFKRKKG